MKLNLAASIVFAAFTTAAIAQVGPNIDDLASKTLTLQPALPYVIGQPAYKGASFDSRSQFGDIAYDLHYSWGGNGWTFGADVVGAVPVSQRKHDRHVG